MDSQRDMIYAAEEAAIGNYVCGDPSMDAAAAQALADAATVWARQRFGLPEALSIRVDEEVTEASAAEIVDRWDADPRAAEVSYLWSGDRPTAWVDIYSMKDHETGDRIGAREHLILHELAHAIVGDWPNVVHGRLDPLGPDRHGALFARRHLDLVHRFHPDCAPTLEHEYTEHGVEVAPADVEPSSWWLLPRPTPDDIQAAIKRAEEA